MVSRSNKNGDSSSSGGSRDNEKCKGKKMNTSSTRTTTMKNAPSTDQTFDVTLEPNRNETDNNLDGLDIELESICEVVISLTCKQCDFTCNDNGTLSRHIKQNHFMPHPQRNSKLCNDNNKKKDCTSTSTANKQIDASPTDNKYKDLTKERKNETFSAEESQVKSSTLSLKERHKRKEPEKQLRNSTDKVEELFLENDNDEDNSKESYEDVFLCAECDIVFSSREACCAHMGVVHGLEEFNTEIFEEDIPDSSDESEKTDSKSETRKINLPKKFTPEAGTIVSKRYRVQKGLLHSCKKCAVKFDSNEVLKFHEKCHTHGFEKSVLAILCDSGSDHSEDVPEKKAKTSNRLSKCEESEIEKSGGQIKVERITYPKTFFCPVCETNRKYKITFPKWAMCAWHLWKEHRIDCELYTCTICKQFKSYYIARVKDHEKLHSDNASHKCKVCNKSFKQKKQLSCHEKYHKEFKTKLAPQVDSRWYTPKECPICKRILSDSKCLKKHISAVHNKLKPFVCNICGHTSARKQELLLHVRQHTGEKPYKCPICDFQTGDHNSLRKHKLRHGDKRPYSCPYCSYRCIQSCAFKKHILAMHPGQDVVFLCHLCSHASVNELLFAAHQKEHDGNTGTEDPLPSTSTNHSLTSSTATSSDSDVDESFSRNLSGDDDSIDIVDNGGVTIPASPTPTSPQPSTSIAAPPSLEPKTSPIGEKNSTPKPIPPITTSQPAEILFEKPNLNSGPFTLLNSFVVLNETNHSGESVLILEPCSNKASIEATGASQLQTLPDQTQSSSAQQFGNKTPSISTQSSKVLAPSCSSIGNNESLSGSTADLLKNQTQDIRSEDNESSSEVIFNPHQLIQNVKLTPLDLTGVFEQSNDEGMLQKLLDMSGV